MRVHDMRHTYVGRLLSISNLVLKRQETCTVLRVENA